MALSSKDLWITWVCFVPQDCHSLCNISTHRAVSVVQAHVMLQQKKIERERENHFKMSGLGRFMFYFIAYIFIPSSILSFTLACIKCNCIY